MGRLLDSIFLRIVEVNPVLIFALKTSQSRPLSTLCQPRRVLYANQGHPVATRNSSWLRTCETEQIFQDRRFRISMLAQFSRTEFFSAIPSRRVSIRTHR